ncbi:hypothetical protein KC19_3G010300 [Ceratodon purpureus]|uniref:C2H2-type domain-containing protein n=1 Tax=Ceratodon purpureus TaxID=3225 RepID=A0A8T0IFX8_CERPU|nr:hypothetical protein KC19_3G010300 [Ceratodon purpureus]
MARHGWVLAQALLAKLTSSPRTSPFTSPVSLSCTVSGIRRLCSQIPLASTVSYVEGEGDGERGESGSLVEVGDGVNDDGSRKVAVFWDLDNKPPKNVPPYDAAVRLIEMAAGFGEVVDVAAYANRYAFAYLPLWVKEQRRERRQLDRLERAGIIKPSEPYVCGYCGRKCKTNEKLKKHFRDLHERERNKRMNRLNSLKGNKRDKFRASLSDKEERYKSAAREVLVPKVGYGLASELRRAGVYVRMVSDKSQAADEALKLHMNRSIRKGIDCICLVSDDSDFANILKLAQSKDLHTVVVGDTSSLTRFADDKFSWREVASGSALARANEVHGLWSFEDGFDLEEEYFDDTYERRRVRARNSGGFRFADSDSEEDLEDLNEDHEAVGHTQEREVWPMESLVNKNYEKKVLTRSDFWWLPGSDEDPPESTQDIKP